MLLDAYYHSHTSLSARRLTSTVAAAAADAADGDGKRHLVPE